MFRNVVLICLCTGMSACATPGGDHPSPFDSAYLKAHVIPGQTTETEIAQMFGQPFQKQSFPALKKDVWVYSSVQTQGQGSKLMSMAGFAAGFIPGAGLLAQASAAGQMANAQTSPSRAHTMQFEFNEGNGTVKDWFGDVQ